MERKTFKKTIHAPREKVWNVLWGEKTYPEWTSPFSPNSRVETDWKKGSRVLFLGGDNRDGMISEVAESIPNEYLSLRHLGAINNGVEDLDSERVKAWAGAQENYTLKDVDGNTELLIEMDLQENESQQMEKIWPLALDKLKQLSENA